MLYRLDQYAALASAAKVILMLVSIQRVVLCGRIREFRHRSVREDDESSGEIMLRRIRAQNSDCWPNERFALLQTIEGCPGGGWAAGQVRHHLKSGSSLSSQNYLSANFEKESVNLHFCVREPNSAEHPEDAYCTHSETSFPPGSYCILNGQPKASIYERCPPQFAWSAVGIDDVGYEEPKRTRGSVPTGEFFPTFSHYYFCCRNDSSPDDAVYLPRSHPFILLPLSSEQKCQQVHGLRSRLFTLFLDSEPGSYVNYPNKHNSPFVITDIVVDGVGSCSREKRGKGLQMHLCYYSRW